VLGVIDSGRLQVTGCGGGADKVPDAEEERAGHWHRGQWLGGGPARMAAGRKGCTGRQGWRPGGTWASKDGQWVGARTGKGGGRVARDQQGRRPSGRTGRRGRQQGALEPVREAAGRAHGPIRAVAER
jgi:hypothetical protein